MNNSTPLLESDLIFSTASKQLQVALGQLKKHNLTIKNRLKSIKSDSQFVHSISQGCALPLIANERCGSWYIHPSQKAGSAYFKSTDGHFGQWGFSLRRLNLQVLDVVGTNGGCVIVDSTRRGKSMPDALSKTVPIWVCVLNRVLFPGDLDAGVLRLPNDVVGGSERIQIEERVEGWVEGVKALGLNLQSLKKKLGGTAMKVEWVRPGDGSRRRTEHDGKNSIALCTASNQTSHETSATSEYVQGAADDPESWAMGLDAKTFWENEEELLRASEDELPDLIHRLVERTQSETATLLPTLVKPTRSLWIGTNDAATSFFKDFDIVISGTKTPDPQLLSRLNERYVIMNLPAGKNGSRLLRTELAKLDNILSLLTSPVAKILVTCHTGQDLAVGVALALLCSCFDEGGSMLVKEQDDGRRRVSVNKDLIRKRLSWIVVSAPGVSPSRATLQSVNSYLMG